MKSQEETYLLSDAEHVSGTNKYIFTFSPHWRSIYNQNLSIAIRSVKLWLAPRSIYMSALSITDGTNGLIISPSVVMNGTWTELNDALFKDKEFHLAGNNVYYINSYVIAYDPTDCSLKFAITNSSDKYYFSFTYSANSDVSDDFKYLTNLTSDVFWSNLSNLTLGSLSKDDFLAAWGDYVDIETNSSGKVILIKFKKLAVREPLKVNASFVDLAKNQYLGITNEQYMPPKQYNINCGDQKFWIELTTIDNQAVEFTDDRDIENNIYRKEEIAIEAIMQAK